MRLYLRGDIWWAQLRPIAGTRHRFSTRCQDELAARLVAVNQERALVIREMIRQDANGHIKRAIERTFREAQNSVVYFVLAESSRQIKIGYARDLEGRIAVMRNGSPERLTVIATIDGSRTLEKELHTRFADLRERGEWFREAEPLVSYLRRLNERYRPDTQAEAAE